jgi:DNA-binding XRE family transcriptional regulator
MKIIANDYEPKDILKIIREWTELSQKDFAKSINRSRDSINNIENGRNRIYLNTLLEIAKKYDITITIEKKKETIKK